MNVENFQGAFFAGCLGTRLRLFANGVGVDLRSDNDYLDGKWHHYTFVLGPGGHEIYQDGYRIERDSTPFAGYSPSSALVGYSYSGGDRYFEGVMDDLIVVSRALSRNEITTHAHYHP